MRHFDENILSVKQIFRKANRESFRETLIHLRQINKDRNWITEFQNLNSKSEIVKYSDAPKL